MTSSEKSRNFREARNHQEIVEKLLRNYRAAGNYFKISRSLAVDEPEKLDKRDS